MIQAADRLSDVKEYYFSKKLREIAELSAQGKPVINIAIGSPDLSPSPSIIKALQDGLSDERAHQYQSYQGIPELRSEMAKFYKEKFGVVLNPTSEILPLMGSKEGIMHISMAYLNMGDEVLIPNPGYPTYASVTNLLQAKAIAYDLTEENDWFPDIDALEQQDLSKVKLMWINYPHMPTGATATKEKFQSLIAFAKRNNILLINDNPYSFILTKNKLSLLELEGANEVAIELNSLSKTFNMAGWRVGMVVGNPEFISTVLKVKSNMDSGMFYGIQKGAVAAMRLNDDWFQQLDSVYISRRNLVWELFDVLKCTYDKNAGGMFVWAKLPEGIKSEPFIDELLYEKSVFITPGTIFGSNGEGYIRASLCTPEDTLREVIKRIK